MHPAKSIILFTVLSGLGNGLLMFLCLGILDVTGWVAFAFFAIAFAMAGGGLMFSFLHLGHPERALKAFSQWRSSWLSREGWLANATLFVAAIYGFFAVFFSVHLTVIGWIAALLALVTVYATSMIYAQLKTVPRWNHWTTSALFLGLSIGGGALLSGSVWVAIVVFVAMAGLQIFAWADGDKALAYSGTNMASATGLGKIGHVTAFEPPHTGDNYLTKEMMHVVARKHSQKLRMIAIGLAFVLPIIFLLIPFSHVLAVFAIVSHLAGMLVLRWLFFAEAEHVVGLYYGKR